MIIRGNNPNIRTVIKRSIISVSLVAASITGLLFAVTGTATAGVGSSGTLNAQFSSSSAHRGDTVTLYISLTPPRMTTNSSTGVGDDFIITGTVNLTFIRHTGSEACPNLMGGYQACYENYVGNGQTKFDSFIYKVNSDAPIGTVTARIEAHYAHATVNADTTATLTIASGSSVRGCPDGSLKVRGFCVPVPFPTTIHGAGVAALSALVLAHPAVFYFLSMKEKEEVAVFILENLPGKAAGFITEFILTFVNNEGHAS